MYDKIVLFAKTKLNSIQVLISKTVTNSSIIHHEFGLINTVVKEYYDLKEEMKNWKTQSVYQRF